MKKILLILAVFSALLLCQTAKSQIFYGFQQLTGTNYAAVLTGFSQTSNNATMPIGTHSLIVTNINTNEIITVSYGYYPSSLQPSNMIALGTFTTNFPMSAGYTNGSTWIYQAPSYYFQPPVSPAAALLISSNGQSGGVPSVTNGVSFQ